MTKLQLMELITTALTDNDVTYSVAGPLADYPMSVYSFVDPSAADVDAPSFSTNTETYRVQLSVFDDQSDGIRALTLLDELKGDLEALRGTEGIIRVRYLGQTGPVNLTTEREWRSTCDYQIITGTLETTTS